MPKLSYYKNKADKSLQEAGRLRYKRCELCGKPVSCLHHFVPKSASSALRYDWDNLIPVCHGCHFKFHSRDSSEVVGKIIMLRGKEWFMNLSKKKSEYIKPSKKYYENICQLMNTK